MFAALFAVLVAGMFSGGAQAATDLRLWHSLSGPPAAEFEALIARYNKAQSSARIRVLRKPQGAGVLAELVRARRAGRAPDIVHLPDSASGDALAAGDAVRLLWREMDEAELQLWPRGYLPAVAGPYSDSRGRLLALPWDVQTPVLYLNRDLWRHARLDPDAPPRTWDEMTQALAALVEAGVRCPLSATSPAWVLVENMSSWHNEEFATRGNGLQGQGSRLAFNTGLGVRWISRLSTWVKSGYFRYAGRARQAERLFVAGQCATLLASSASDVALRRTAGFAVGVAQLPFYDDFLRAPQNTLAGGGALWLTGQGRAAARRAAANFIGVLLRAEVQLAWHQRTGFVPLRLYAYERSKEDGYYRGRPAAEIAVRQILFREPTPDSRGIRIASHAQVRTFIEEELEAVWSGKKAPREALDAAVARGNALIARAERAPRIQQASRAQP